MCIAVQGWSDQGWSDRTWTVLKHQMIKFTQITRSRITQQGLADSLEIMTLYFCRNNQSDPQHVVAAYKRPSYPINFTYKDALIFTQYIYIIKKIITTFQIAKYPNLVSTT